MSPSLPLYCAAVDLGATSGRVMLGTWDGARLITKEVHRFPNSLRTVGGHDYWDVVGLWDEVQDGLAKAVAGLPEGIKLASVGVDTWGVDYVLLNDDGRLVFPTHAYRDARTQPGLLALQQDPEALARIYRATGIPAVFFNSSLQLAETVVNFPAIKELATHCLFLPDYFNYLLSGRMANGLAIGSTTQLLNVDADAWSAEALSYFGIPPHWLSAPVSAQTRLGPAINIPGLETTEVIAVPGHDTTCAYDAMPASANGDDIFISSGTWSLVGFEHSAPVLGAEALAVRVANDRTGRGEYRPLINVIGLWLLEGTLKDFASRPTNDAGWDHLITEATALPQPERLLDVADPAFANPPSMKAAIDAQLVAHGCSLPSNLAGYMRLICASLGQGHADVIRRFERLADRTFQRILMVGGGSKNALLCQATADAAGLSVYSYSLEGSAVGNIANQLIALGAVSDLATFRTHLTKQLTPRIYEPAG